MVSNVGVTSLLLLVGLASAHRPTSEFQTVLDVDAAEAKRGKVQRSSLEQASEANATAKANATARANATAGAKATIEINNECAGYWNQMTTLTPKIDRENPVHAAYALHWAANDLQCPEFFRVLCGGFKQWTGIVATGMKEIDPLAKRAHGLVREQTDCSQEAYDEAVGDMTQLVDKFDNINQENTFAWALHRLALSYEQIKSVVDDGQVKLDKKVIRSDFMKRLYDVVYMPAHIENNMVHVNDVCPSFNFDTTNKMYGVAKEMEAPDTTDENRQVRKPNAPAGKSFFGGLWGG